MNRFDNICYQLSTYFFINKLNVNKAGIQVLALLALKGEQKLKEFCEYIYTKKIYSSEQAVRNILNKFEEQKFIIKNGRKSKMIKLNPDIKVITSGNILLDYKILTRDSD